MKEKDPLVLVYWLSEIACPKLTYHPENPTLKVVYSNLKDSGKGCAGFYRYIFPAHRNIFPNFFNIVFFRCKHLI